MNENAPETPSPEVCASKIFELSGSKFAPDVAVELWPRIMRHKWLMSEKLRRDVGLRIEYLFQKVAQWAFEREYASKQDYKVTTDTFAEIVGQIRPSLTDEMIEEFRQDSVSYTRT